MRAILGPSRKSGNHAHSLRADASPRYARPTLPLTRMRYHSSTVGVITGWHSGALGVYTGRNRESECGGEEKVMR